MILIGFTGTIFAVPEPVPEDDFRYSDHVITGKIISSEIIIDPREDNSSATFYDTIIYKVKIEKWHKNPLASDTITVYGTRFPNDVIPEPNWGVVEFDIGDTVYLYLDKTDDGLKFREYGSKLLYSKDSGKTEILSPLKQFKSGIPNYKITCKEGLKLLIRTNDGSSACVKPDTATELQTRWHKMDSKSTNSEINTMCMTLEKSKDIATFFKVPSYLPDGYSFKCSFSGTPYESYLIFDNKKVPDGWISHYPELVSDGEIFIHQTDEKSAVGEKKFATYGTATQRIQDTYDEVMLKNPSLHPQLIQINGMLAYGVDSCSDCGMQTANFTDGVIIQKTATDAKIKFIDKNGVNYFLKAGIPLSELIKVAESLQ